MFYWKRRGKNFLARKEEPTSSIEGIYIAVSTSIIDHQSTQEKKREAFNEKEEGLQL